jgi:hypothetical protein
MGRSARNLLIAQTNHFNNKKENDMRYQTPAMQSLGDTIRVVKSGAGTGKPNGICTDSALKTSHTSGAYEIDE